MGLELGTLSVELKADDSDLNRKLSRAKSNVNEFADSAQKAGDTKLNVKPTGEADLKNATKSTQQLGSELEKTAGKARKTTMPTQPREETERWRESIRKTGEDLGSSLGKWANKGVKWAGITAGTAAIGGMGTALTKGFNRLNSLDQATAKLEALGNTSEDVQSIMDNALSSVKGTAFGIGEAAGTAATMVASGVEPGQQLESVLKGVADSAAVAGVGMDEMGLVWGKVAAKGKLDGETLAQMLERQIPIYDILAEKTGHTSAEIADMVTEGKIDFQTFADAMNDYVGGGALRMGDTFSGAIDNMWAAAGRLGAAFLEPAFDAAPGVVGNITDSIDDLTERVKPVVAEWGQKLGPVLSDFGQNIGPNVAASVGMINDALKIAAPLIGDVAKVAGDIPFPLIVGGVAAVVSQHKGWNDALGKGAGAIGDFAGTLGAFVKGDLPRGETAMKGLKGAGEGLLGIFGGPWGLAIGAAAGVVGYLADQHFKAKKAEEEHAAYQKSLKDSLDETTGAITEQTSKLIENQLTESGALQAAKELNLTTQTMVDAAQGNADAQARVKSVTDGAMRSAIESTDAWDRVGGALEAAGYNSLDLAEAMGGNKEKMEELSGVTGFMHKETRELESAVANTRDKYGTLIDSVNGTTDALNDATTENAREQLENLQQSAKQTDDALRILGDRQFTIEDEKTIKVSAEGIEEVRGQLEKVGVKVSQPMNGEVSLTFEKGADIPALLDTIGIKLSQTQDGYIQIHADDIAKASADLDAMGIKVMTLPNGHLGIDTNSPEVMARLQELGIAAKNPITGKVEIDWNAILTSDEQMNLLRDNVQAGANGHANITDNTGDANANVNNMRNNVQAGAQGKATITDNAEATRSHIKSTLSEENTNTKSWHEISIVRWITDKFKSERADGGIDAPVQAFANGGHRVNQAVARRAKSSHEPSHQAHIAPAGSYRVFAEEETGGEAYIPMAQSKRARSEKILGAVANQFGYELIDGQTGEVQQFADGALVPASAVVDRLKFMTGTPYVFGGWSKSGVDCSGAISLGVNVSEGLDPWDSRTATAGEGAWLQQKGYRQGKGSAGDIRVAFYNGGPGGGHTAMQLDDGTFIESGGNTGGGFTIGAPAGPLENRGFTDWYYKPGAAPLGNTGLGTLDELAGAVGVHGVGHAIARVATSDSDTDTSTTSTSTQRELNGGNGTLLKDGSFLEAMAALYSLKTGKPMDDDIVSWGQVVGLYSKASEDDIDKVSKELDKNSDTLEKTKEKLAAAKADLPTVEEDLRIKKMKRDETYNKTDKKGNKTATDSQKAAADQSVVKAEEKVQETKDKIAKLEAEQKELEAAQAELKAKQQRAGMSGKLSDTDSAFGMLGLYDDLTKTTKGVGGTSGNKYADAIIKEGQRRGITDRGIIIALATALVESGLKMYANPADPQSLDYPHDAVGYDHDSVGLFQQRNNGAWGTLADRMDPARSAGMFYDRLDDQDYNTGDMGAHAQRVQGSAFPDRYATKMSEAQGLLDAFNNTKNAKVTAMANGGILGGLRQAQINDGSSAVLWAEAGPEAYIPLSSDKRAKSLDIWAETGKRLGVDVMSMFNLIGSTLPNLMEGNLSFSTGASVSAEKLGVNMGAASYRGQKAVENAVGAVFNGPVQINDPKKYLQGQLDSASKQLGKAMRSVML